MNNAIIDDRFRRSTRSEAKNAYPTKNNITHPPSLFYNLHLPRIFYLNLTYRETTTLPILSYLEIQSLILNTTYNPIFKRVNKFWGNREPAFSVRRTTCASCCARNLSIVGKYRSRSIVIIITNLGSATIEFRGG